MAIKPSARDMVEILLGPVLTTTLRPRLTAKIDLYAGIHKGQRDHLSKFSKQAGTLNKSPYIASPAEYLNHAQLHSHGTGEKIISRARGVRNMLSIE